MIAVRPSTGVFLGAALVTGCATTELQNTNLPVGGLNISSVAVSAGSLARITGRDFMRSDALVEQDLTQVIKQVLAGYSDPAGTPVDVLVDVREIILAGPAARAVGQVSSIRAGLTAVSPDAVVVEPQEIIGESTTIRVPGALGLITTPNVDKDYNDTLYGFALTLQQLLF